MSNLVSESLFCYYALICNISLRTRPDVEFVVDARALSPYEAPGSYRDPYIAATDYISTLYFRYTNMFVIDLSALEILYRQWASKSHGQSPAPCQVRAHENKYPRSAVCSLFHLKESLV